MSGPRKALVDVVQEFCTSSDIEKDFETFAADYVDIFDGDFISEHKLAYYDAYKEYLNRFEGKIERFIQLEGYEPEEFYRQCRDILDDEEFSSRTFFIEVLLASSEYEYFCSTMKLEAQRIRHMGK